MIRRVRKLWNIFLTLAALAILATVLVAPTSLDAQNAPPPKNLKVLTPENFMAQMKTFKLLFVLGLFAVMGLVQSSGEPSPL